MASDKEVALTVGPFRGMNDTPALSAQDANRAAYLENLYSPAGAVGGDLISRLGYTRIPLQSTLTGTASKSGTTITGVGTAFTTEMALGDIIEISGTKMLITAIASATSATASVSGTVASGAITRYAGGIVGGPILGAYRYANTDGTIKRYLLARTTSVLACQGAASQYCFDDSDATTTALTGTVAGFNAGSANVIGTGTAFLTEVQVGMLITFAGVAVATEITGGYRNGQTFRVTGVFSNTLLTVHTLNTGTGAPGAVTTMTVQSGGIRLLEYNPSSTPTIVDRTSATMDGVSLDTSARIYGVSFANYLILSDGTNRPRKINSTFVLSNLTDGNYAVKAAPVVYYGKLFIIDNSDAATLRWSDESDPDTGYGTGTSDNSWTLRQTSSDPLECLAATNDALYCFRTNSTAIITGAANADFRSSGSVDAIQAIGCRSPDSIVLVNSSVVFLDQFGHPGRLAPGYGYLPLYLRIQETLRAVGVSAAQLRAAWGRYDPITELVKFGYRGSSGATTNDQMLAFETEQWECLGLHKWYSAGTTAMDHAYSSIWEDENSYPRHVVASGTTGDVAFYIQKADTSITNAAQDTVAAGAQTIPVIVESAKVGGDVRTEKTFSRVVVASRNVGGTTAGVTLWKSQHKGPYATAYSSADTMWLGNGQTVPSTMTLDGNAVKADQAGLNLRGRWAQFKFTNDTTGNPVTRATFDTLTVVATERGADGAAF